MDRKTGSYRHSDWLDVCSQQAIMSSGRTVQRANGVAGGGTDGLKAAVDVVSELECLFA